MSFTPYPNRVFTTFSFIGFLMCIIPLPWHLKAWNVGTCLFMFWAGIGCLFLFVNSIVWHGNAFNPTPIWCDICVKIITGSFTGISASSLCINRRLYLLQLDPARYFAITMGDKIRSVAVDLGISLVLPIIMISLHYVFQGHRFEIREDLGCCPHSRNTLVAVLLMSVPPALLGIVSATYGIRTIISINKRHLQLNEHLAHRLNITSSLYFRILCFAGIEALSTTPIAVSFIVFNVKRAQLYPLTSWEHSRPDFNRVDQFPAIVWHNFPDASAYEFTRWIFVLAAFIFFSIFGFAEEAKSHYRLAINFFLKLIGIRVGRQTGASSLMLQSEPPECVTFNKSPRRNDSFSTISDSGRSKGEQWASSGTVPHTQDFVDDHMGSQTAQGLDSPGSLTSTINARVPAAVEQ